MNRILVFLVSAAIVISAVAAPIIGTLPNTISNGQPMDAVPLMADFNWIVNQTNANAAGIGNANSFSAVQSGIAGTAAASFPIVSQIQNQAFSWAGVAGGTGNAITLTPTPASSAYQPGQIFWFQASATNSGATTVNISSLGTLAVQVSGSACAGGEIINGKWYGVLVDSSGTTAQLIRWTWSAQAGANTDITSLNAPSIGASTATTQTSTDNSTKVATTAFVHSVASLSPTLHQQVFTSSGTFTIPSGTIAGTVFKVTVVGGGGGGGNSAAYQGGSGGGAGGTAIIWESGWTAGNTIAVTIGAGGAAQATGGNSTIASGTQTITTVTGTGGAGGVSAYGNGGAGGGGTNGTFNISGGGGGSASGVSAGSGVGSAGVGGSSILGGGGYGANGTGSIVGGPGATNTGGGGGGGSYGGNGGAGGSGVVIFEWVL